MAIPGPNTPSLSLDVEAELRAQAAEMERVMQQLQQEFELQQHEVEARVAAMPQPEATSAPPEPDPAQLATFRQMEAEYGLPIAPEEPAYPASEAGPAHGVGKELKEKTIEKVLEKALEKAIERQQEAPHPKRQRQWFVGPLAENQLLDLLNKGALPRQTLVWNSQLKQWTPASETSLSDQE